MSHHLLKCPACQRYTLLERCLVCSTSTQESKPPKFSPEDKYGSYRREIKKKEWAKQGLY